MIINFSVENFGSIKEKQTLSFEADNSKHLEKQFVIHTDGGVRLLKLALIYGANASGKTTVLKALDFLRDIVLSPVRTKTEELDFNPFLFDENTKGKPTLLSIDFIQSGIKYTYEVSLLKRAIVSEVLYFYSPNKATVYNRSTDLVNQFTTIEFGSKIKKEKSFESALAANTLWNNTVLGGYLKTNIEQPQLKEVLGWFGDYLHPKVSTRTELLDFITKKLQEGEIKKQDIISILKQADFNISDLSIDKRREVPDGLDDLLKVLKMTDEQIERLKKDPPRQIQFEHKVDGKTYELPIEQESEGTKRYFEFAGLLCLLIKNSMAVPIDELESSLHPDLYIHFLLSFLINAKNSQVIATTHNREILNNKDLFRNDAIWFTDKSEGCATQLYSLVDFDSSIVRDTSNILNAYKSGKLKGTPNLSDYYIHVN
jgi:AAA15 family ATPase/GTPase